MKKAHAILAFCEDNNIEIISYGLAPNPNGFCYELFGDACSDEAQVLDDMLDGLSSREEQELRKLVFGGF